MSLPDINIDNPDLERLADRYAALKEMIAEKDSAIAEKDSAIAE